MSKWHYERAKDSFQLIDDGDTLVLGTDRVGILFDAECGTLLKHGDAYLVEKRYQEMDVAYREAGFGNMANNLVFVSAPDWDIDELNKFLHCTGYVGVWWREKGLALFT